MGKRKSSPKDRKIGRNTLVIYIVLVGFIVGYAQLSKWTSSSVDRGEKLYQTYCVSCHGVKGVGERPDDIYAMDEYGFVAPPMDDTGHAWHHTDEALINTILDGSPRNPRMTAWKEVLSREDAEDLVPYIKSLWSPYIRENCQGPKHMECM